MIELGPVHVTRDRRINLRTQAKDGRFTQACFLVTFSDHDLSLRLWLNGANRRAYEACGCGGELVHLDEDSDNLRCYPCGRDTGRPRPNTYMHVRDADLQSPRDNDLTEWLTARLDERGYDVLTALVLGGKMSDVIEQLSFVGRAPLTRYGLHRHLRRHAQRFTAEQANA